MRKLTPDDFNLGRKATIKLIDDEEAVFVIDRSKEAKALRGKNVSPIVYAFAGTAEEMDAVERQYLSYKYRIERIRYSQQKEQEREERYKQQANAVLPSLEMYINVLMATRPDAFEGMNAYDIWTWLNNSEDKLRQYLDMRFPFEQIVATILYPAALIIKQRKLNIYDMGLNFFAEIPEAEPRVAVNVFSCLPQTFMVNWDDPEDGPEFFLVNTENAKANAEGKKQVQLTFWEFTEYSEVTKDFRIMPHSGGIFTSGETARESNDKMLQEIQTIAKEIGLDVGMVRDMFEARAGLKNSNSKTDALMSAIYKIVDTNMDPCAVASVEIRHRRGS